MQQLIDGIQVKNNLIITLAKTKVKEYKLGNWIGVVSYMETKVAKSFRFAKGNKNQVHGSNGRRFSAVEVRGRGCGSRVL